MNRCVPVVSAGSDLPQKYWSEARNRAKGHVRRSRRRPIRRPGKPRKAIVSLQIIAISVEWAKSNPCHCPRGISQRPTKRAPEGSRSRGNRLRECDRAELPARIRADGEELGRPGREQRRTRG